MLNHQLTAICVTNIVSNDWKVSLPYKNEMKFNIFIRQQLIVGVQKMTVVILHG